ncbi:hypothetical protein MN032_01820 [Agromyces atrinae]|uniref:Uncharacterized protein n=1 Tax=Agromyces atrinae TaxID=592376 RepID=A0A4V1R2M3_9MICO|nr:hypothetical protein [Agromyces atrinae]MCI2956416.1 hypothetical protein [Agromyces atrinae]NYD68205.1 hypothetical protein [Agromyces atrinae]RXZ87656.1 hypothetical protein ESP50_00155 [Agromyces atrinae]
MWEKVAHGVVRDRVSGIGWEAGRITGGDRRVETVEQRGRVTVTKRVSISTPQRSVNLGYLAITLPRRLPHMVLDGRSNGRGMLVRPRRDQRLDLEGDFNSHFRLFVPKGYERDALYVFTPDLMALLIDETGDMDVEVRDDRLIVFRPGGFDLSNPATWQRFERIRETLGAKALTRTDRYVDERAAQPLGSVAAPGDVGADGARLKTRLPWGVWLGIGIAAGALVFAGTIVTVVLTAIGTR